MTLGPVTKHDNSNKAMLKSFTMTSYQQIVRSLPFSQFLANLEQSGSWIPDVWSVKPRFSLTVTFYLTKIKKQN